MMRRHPVYLDVPYAEKDEARALGAHWDPERRRWYVPHGVDLAPLRRWMPPPTPRQLPTAPTSHLPGHERLFVCRLCRRSWFARNSVGTCPACTTADPVVHVEPQDYSGAVDTPDPPLRSAGRLDESTLSNAFVRRRRR